MPDGATTRDLIVERMEVTLTRWPLKMKRRHGVGDVERSMPGVILKLTTRGGLVGWGEAAPWSVFSGTAEGNAAALDVYLRALVVGRSASDVQTILDAADHAVVGHAEAKAALEMALDDLRGKALGVPCAELHGGVVRRDIPLSVSVADPDFEADLDFVRARLAEGVRLYKVKTGFLTHREDLVRLERLAAVLPADAEIRIDYNQGLEAWDALRKLRDMEAFRPGFIEQPVARERRDAMAMLAAALDTPILADESCFSPAEAVEMVRRGFADAVSVKLMKCGGVRRAKEIAAIGGAAGIPAYGGTMFEAGVALAAGIHCVASTPNICLGAEFYTANHVIGVDILERPLDLSNGASHLPDAPGLGVAVDAAALRSVTVEARG
ncbi:MAG: cycloisomerase [Rhizobiales bacterium]|nr:cycloisomerase [Hyphomicrobiales bacterium]